MSDDRKIMKVGLLVAITIIVVRILLEQAGVPATVSNIFGVVWLYFILPVLFALAIRAYNHPHPYRVLLKDVLLLAIITRAMVMVTYILAYYLKWTAPRFAASQGGVPALQGVFFNPAHNALIWFVTATIIGMITGSITLLLKRKRSIAAPAA